MTDKDFDDLKKKVEELERKIDKQRINNLASSLPALITGTINTGDATTDTILVSIKNRLEKVISNIQGQ